LPGSQPVLIERITPASNRNATNRQKQRHRPSQGDVVDSVAVSDNVSSSPALPQYPRTDQEFSDRFANEDDCSAYLERLRWGKGFCCPKCESPKGWRTATGHWACSSRQCARKVSVTSGTAFDRSRIPLRNWFTAACYLAECADGISALALQQELHLASYQPAWSILQKLRAAMKPSLRGRLRGRIEVASYGIGAEQALHHRDRNGNQAGR
jgi:hypothetical protein